MPRQSPNREDGEAGAEDRDRCIKKVIKYILVFSAPIFCLAILGNCIAYFGLKNKTLFLTYSLPISLLAFVFLIIGLFLYLWQSNPRYRREIRGQYRNFRRAIRRIRLPEFCTRHLRRVRPQPRDTVNTIPVRPQPTASYAVAGCSVQIETPSPIRPLAPILPVDKDIETLSLSSFEDSYRSHLNILHKD